MPMGIYSRSVKRGKCENLDESALSIYENLITSYRQYKHTHKYLKTPKGKLYDSKRCNKRHRDMGFNPLNKWFKGSNAHHINNIDVIYIPKELHIKYSGHNHNNPKTMVEINIQSFLFMNASVYTYLVESWTLNYND